MKPASNPIIVFTGPFSEFCDKFITLKRSLGCKYKSEAHYLRMFDDFSKSFNPSGILTKELICQWIQKRPHETSKTHSNRISVVRQFALYMADLGQDSYIPPAQNFKISRNYVPYIFTKDELIRIFQAADKIKKQVAAPFSHLIMPVLFRMLYCCGLRVSEALELRVCDVNLSDGVLTIRNAKFNKDRLVPMSSSLVKVCDDYAKKALITAKSTDYFFPAPDKGRYSSKSIYNKFRVIMWQCGISHGGRGKGPRLHDVRHVFTCHSLSQWVKAGKDIYCLLPILSTYLGHESISATQGYLRLTPELFPDIVNAFENKYGQVIPEGRNL